MTNTGAGLLRNTPEAAAAHLQIYKNKMSDGSFSPTEDGELLSHIRGGSFEAFRALVKAYQHRVINTCYGFLKNREDAEDAAQEVFIEVYRSVSGFRGETKLSTWIYRIAVTRSLDLLRKRSRKKRASGRNRRENFDDLEHRLQAPEADWPEDVFKGRERAGVLSRAVDSLPQSQRIAVVLNLYEGFSSHEIADIMRTSPSAVEGLVHRAKTNLKKKLRSYYEKYE